MNEKKKYLKLEDISAYRIASDLADIIFEKVSHWDWFNKKTLGIQLINAIDSIAGNIAEGFGRYHKKDKMKFYFNSRGSLFESAHWVKKAHKRKLFSDEETRIMLVELRKLPKEINSLIKLTDDYLKE